MGLRENVQCLVCKMNKHVWECVFVSFRVIFKLKAAAARYTDIYTCTHVRSIFPLIKMDVRTYLIEDKDRKSSYIQVPYLHTCTVDYKIFYSNLNFLAMYSLLTV